MPAMLSSTEDAGCKFACNLVLLKTAYHMKTRMNHLVRLVILLMAVSLSWPSRADVLELTHTLVRNLADITPEDVQIDGHVQGLLVRDGYAFVFHHGGQVLVYNLDADVFVSSYYLPGNKSHCNNASFGTERYSSKSAFPMAYVSDCTYDGSCYVYDLYTDHAVEVQRIFFTDTPVPVQCGTGWFVDESSGRLCVHWKDQVWDFPIPSKHRKTVRLSVEGKKPSGRMNTPRIHQGACAYQGYHFFPSGLAYEPTYLTVNDPSSGQTWSFPTDRTVCPLEPEGVCGWDGGVYVSYTGGGKDLLLYRFEVKKRTPAPGEMLYNYTDARTLGIVGKACQGTAEPFSRLPASLAQVSREPVWKLGRCSAGLAVRFSSDAGAFNFRWTSADQSLADNMSPIGVRGLALYVYDEGAWVFAGSTRVNIGQAESESCLRLSLLEGQQREYMVYLSLYDGVLDLQIGVGDGFTIGPPALDSPRMDKPVVAYGTSILQGGSASHPGMAGTNILSRMLDREVVNLGFSGNALLDEEIAGLMAAVPDPGAYVLDNTPNCSADLIREKTAGFYRILREAHPDVPVVFVQPPLFPTARFNGEDRDVYQAKTLALEEVFNALSASGEQHIYLVRSAGMITEDNVGTIEGTHFTDDAFQRWAECLYGTLQPFYL